MGNEMPRGRPKTITDQEVFEAALDVPEPCFGKREVASQLSIGAEMTRKRLNQLVEQGLLNSKKIGSTTVYWVADLTRSPTG